MCVRLIVGVQLRDQLVDFTSRNASHQGGETLAGNRFVARVPDEQDGLDNRTRAEFTGVVFSRVFSLIEHFLGPRRGRVAGGLVGIVAFADQVGIGLAQFVERNTLVVGQRCEAIESQILLPVAMGTGPRRRGGGERWITIGCDGSTIARPLGSS